MAGELVDDRVIVDDPAEASGVYNRGFFGSPRPGGGLDREDAPARLRGGGERPDVLQRPRGPSARPPAGDPPEDRRRRAFPRRPGGRDRRGPGEDAPRSRLLREDRRSAVAAQPPRDRVPVESRSRRSAKRGHGPPHPTGPAHQGGEGGPAGLRAAPPCGRGPDGPRGHLENRFQVWLPLPGVRGRPGDPSREVPRPCGAEGPPRGVAGNQPGRPTRARREETDPLRRSRTRCAIREARTREALTSRSRRDETYL